MINKVILKLLDYFDLFHYKIEYVNDKGNPKCLRKRHE